MYSLIALSCLSITLAASVNPVTSDPHAFRVPVVSRGYQNYDYTQAGEESINSYANTIAALAPTYVSGLVYLEVNTTIEDDMVQFYSQIVERVRSNVSGPGGHQVWFDIEVSMNPRASPHFTGPDNVTATLEYFDSMFHPDGWWFDFWSDAYDNVTKGVDSRPWVEAAVEYAAQHKQSIGGNNYGSTFVVGSDVIAFTDGPNGGLDGYGINVSQLNELVQNSTGNEYVLLGHMQSNPQNQGEGTFSCDYNLDWTRPERVQYLTSWAVNQTAYNYTFMYPGFWPVCPVDVTYNPRSDSQGEPLLPALQSLISEYNNGTFSTE